MDARILKIGECRLDVGQRGIVRDGQLIHVEPRDFGVLMHLIDNAPNVVSSNQLIRRAWGSKIVGDNALHQAIGRLRKLFGDNARKPDYIQTHSKLGYQFIAPVLPLAPAIQATADIGPMAVLPFRDYTPGNKDPYIADGMCFEICRLLMAADTQVVSMDRAARVQRGGYTDLEVAGRVGARTVLTGSLMIADERIRITANLSDVDSERQAWSFRYDLPVGQIFDLHSVASAAIVKGILEYHHAAQNPKPQPLQSDTLSQWSRDRKFSRFQANG